MKITYISSFTPRKCGIATYTKDLSLEVEKNARVSVVAMHNTPYALEYPKTVKRIIRQEQKLDYIQTAEWINNSDTDVVHLEHEFGLFGGNSGEYIISLLTRLEKPLITTLHTVLTNPTPLQRQITQALLRYSQKVVVMEEIARERLYETYGVDKNRISVIPHGSPKVTKTQRQAKKEIGLSDSYIMLSSNLLDPRVGFQYALKAVAKAAPYIPNLKYLIVGQTHPSTKKHQGEKYRQKLQNLVKKLHIQNNVIFVNKYVTLEELTTYLAAADVFITPYLNPQQITSGALAYAIGAGKVCISTDYIYAQKLLAKERGIIVPFRTYAPIADTLVDLYVHPEKAAAISMRAKEIGSEMTWESVAAKHVMQYEALTETKSQNKAKIFSYPTLPAISIQMATGTPIASSLSRPSILMKAKE